MRPSRSHSWRAGGQMPESPLPFHVRKIGHVVLNVSDLEAATRFYTGLLGLQVSDRYNESMVPGGMVFLRCNTDHHGVALVGGAPRSGHSTLNHFAFEVGTLDEVFRARAWLRKNGAGAEHLVQRPRSEEHTSELQSQSNLVCRLLLEKK